MTGIVQQGGYGIANSIPGPLPSRSGSKVALMADIRDGVSQEGAGCNKPYEREEEGRRH